MMDKIAKAVGVVVIAAAIVAGFSTLFALPVKWAWNYAVSPTFHMPEIGWLQAFCLSFLAGTFFKSTTSSSSSS